ncbi:hypothetical protein [Kordia sp.]|uniref:hypothetical protein n=1 Tax=Kordia sp. TaxID=1965332 RepID=UPI003B5A5FCD
MKQFTLLLLLGLLFTSCNNEKVSNMEHTIDALQKEVTELKAQNKLLKDSLLTTNVESRLLNSQLIGSPTEGKILVNKENKINLRFQEDWRLPPYDVYQIIENGEKITKKLLLKQQTKPFFEITVFPKNKKDNETKLEAVFDFDGNALTIPAHMNYHLE